MPRRKSQSGKRASRGKHGARLSLMLVDDHPMWRATLRNLLDYSKVATVVAEAGNGKEALERASVTSPDLVIMDVNLPTMDGIQATRLLVANHPDTKVLILASSDDKKQVIDAVRAGASGYLLKTADPDEVVAAVRRIQEGEMVFPPALASIVLGQLRGVERQQPELRVVVADEEVIHREGLTRLLREAGIEVVASASDVSGLVDEIEANHPDVAVIDASLAVADRAGRAVTEHIRSQYPGVSVLILSADPVAAQAMSLLSRADGSIGYLLKKRISNIGEVSDAVARVAQGETVVDPQLVSGLVDQPVKSGALEPLTDREKEVLALMAEGHSNQAIAEHLFVGPKTIETHVGRIFTKLGLEPAGDVHRRVLAVLAYLRSG